MICHWLKVAMLVTTEEIPATITLLATDMDSSGLTLQHHNWPGAWLLSGAAPDLTYTPVVNFTGTDSFTFKANDGFGGSNLATVTVIVTPVNDSPQAFDDVYQTDEDSPLVVSAPGVLANDIEVDLDHIVAVLLSLPSHGKVTIFSDGSFIYDPDLNFNGQDSFMYRMVTYPSKEWVDEATVTITVNPLNDAPLAPALADVEWLARLAHEYTISGFTDVDGDPLTYSATLAGGISLPDWLVVDPISGALNGMPQNDDMGEYSILVTASDGNGGSVTSVFSLTVRLNPFMIFLPAVLH